MIERGGTKGNVIFTLTCDYCGEECEEVFETWDDAVDYKTNRECGWASVKDKNGDWQELCPSCNTPEVIAQLKGTTLGVPEGKARGEAHSAAQGAQLALEALFEEDEQ